MEKKRQTIQIEDRRALQKIASRSPDLQQELEAKWLDNLQLSRLLDPLEQSPESFQKKCTLPIGDYLQGRLRENLIFRKVIADLFFCAETELRNE